VHLAGESGCKATLAAVTCPVLVSPREVMMRLRIHLLLTALAVAAVGSMPIHAADNTR